MVYAKITDEMIERVCGYLEFYDKHHYLPFRKKKILLSLSGVACEKLDQQKNKSQFVEELILHING